MGFQHLFHRLSTGKTKERLDITETYKTLIDARIDRLESNFQLLRTEWGDSYEKLMLLYDRTRKRIKASEVASEREKPPDPPQDPITRDSILRAFRKLNGEQ